MFDAGRIGRTSRDCLMRWFEAQKSDACTMSDEQQVRRAGERERGGCRREKPEEAEGKGAGWRPTGSCGWCGTPHGSYLIASPGDPCVVARGDPNNCSTWAD